MPPTFRVLALALVAIAIAGSALAQQPLAASPDITVEIGGGPGSPGTVVLDEDVVVDNQLGLVALENLGPLPQPSDVIAFALDLGGDRLMAFETTVALPGGLVARPGDVIRYDGAVYTTEMDASVAGVPVNVRTDAVSVAPGGRLLVSFDTDATLRNGLVVADEDLALWHGGSTFTLAFDGSAMGLNSSLDIDGVQDLGGGALLLSFDTTGTVAGIAFRDEDVVRFEGGAWSLEIDASTLDGDWEQADLDGLMVPEPGAAPMLVAGMVFLAQLVRMRGRVRG